MNGILVTGGELPGYESVKALFNEKAYIAAADSGLDYCFAHGIVPHCILGDMDSLAFPELLEEYGNSIIKTYSTEKDYTDTELGMDHLEKAGCDCIIIIGGGGGRLDHLLAMAALFDRQKIPDLWISHNEVVHSISQELKGRGEIAETISFFPCGLETCTMKSQGLRWPLDNLVWKKGDMGISNQLLDENFRITMTTGRLMMIRTLNSRWQQTSLDPVFPFQA